MWIISGLFPTFSARDNLIRECGLCAIKPLAEAGVNALKVVSRGKTLKGKLAVLSLLNKVVNNPKADPDFCKQIRGRLS